MRTCSRPSPPPIRHRGRRSRRSRIRGSSSPGDLASATGWHRDGIQSRPISARDSHAGEWSGAAQRHRHSARVGFSDINTLAVGRRSEFDATAEPAWTDFRAPHDDTIVRIERPVIAALLADAKYLPRSSGGRIRCREEVGRRAEVEVGTTEALRGEDIGSEGSRGPRLSCRRSVAMRRSNQSGCQVPTLHSPSPQASGRHQAARRNCWRFRNTEVHVSYRQPATSPRRRCHCRSRAN